ncbi:MAG: anti-sigma factor antagonist [Planctomycetes bacterium]|nr:anti-sigma factor antagonist [Planctomycetota bacterium]
MMTEVKKKTNEPIMQVYHTGDVTVVGFGGGAVNTKIDFSLYRDVLTELVHRYDCRILAIDLAGVKELPAGLLGVMVPIRKLVERIEIHNPTDSVRDMLIKIQVASLFDICESVA